MLLNKLCFDTLKCTSNATLVILLVVWEEFFVGDLFGVTEHNVKVSQRQFFLRETSNSASFLHYGVLVLGGGG